jgi:hypothetical protein
MTVKINREGSEIHSRRRTSFVEVSALPPNKALQLTRQLVTPFAKRRAKGAPSCLAAEL